MDEFVKVLLGEWRIIMSAPITFIAGAVILAVVVWGAMQWRYSGQIESKDATIQIQAAQLDQLRAKSATGRQSSQEGGSLIRRHFTPSDKDRLRKALQQLSEILNTQGPQIIGEAGSIYSILSSLPDRLGTLEGLNRIAEPTIQTIRSTKEKTEKFRNEVFGKFLNSNKNFNDELVLILGNDLAIRNFIQALDNDISFILDLKKYKTDKEMWRAVGTGGPSPLEAAGLLRKWIDERNTLIDATQESLGLN